MVFLVLFLIPLLVLPVAWAIWKKVTVVEAGIHIGIQAIVAGTSALICYYSTVTDVEVWNGYVTDKRKETVSCSHSYSCNCRESCSGSGKNRSCSTVCDTCYEHFHDYDWNVYTSNNETVTIARVDRQGSNKPERWDAVRMGEETAVPHNYTSYIKGAPDTLFRRQGHVEKYKGKLPEYPQVVDYYKMARYVSAVPGQNADSWNQGLASINADLGHNKQANMLVVLTTEGPDWYYALEEYWLGGKKNDIVLVIGMDVSGKAAWANVMAWTNQEIFKVTLRDAVLGLPKIDHETVLPVLRDNVSARYVRKPMADFEYLKSSVSPSVLQWTISLLIGFVVSAMVTVFVHVNGLGFSRSSGLGMKFPSLARKPKPFDTSSMYNPFKTVPTPKKKDVWESGLIPSSDRKKRR